MTRGRSCFLGIQFLHLVLSVMLPTRVLGLLNQQKLIGGQASNSGKALLGPLLQQEGAKTSNSFPCSLPEGQRAGSLYAVRCGSWGQAGGVAQVFCPPLWWCCVQGACTEPCFSPDTLLLLPALQKWHLSFFFSVFLYLVHNLPQLRMHSYFQSLLGSLYLVDGGAVCPGASAAAEGPSLSQTRCAQHSLRAVK